MEMRKLRWRGYNQSLSIARGPAVFFALNPQTVITREISRGLSALLTILVRLRDIVSWATTPPLFTNDLRNGLNKI
jgi:hypothetical protein